MTSLNEEEPGVTQQTQMDESSDKLTVEERCEEQIKGIETDHVKAKVCTYCVAVLGAVYAHAL